MNVLLLVLHISGAWAASNNTSYKDLLQGYLTGQLSSALGSYQVEALKREFKSFTGLMEKKFEEFKEFKENIEKEMHKIKEGTESLHIKSIVYIYLLTNVKLCLAVGNSLLGLRIYQIYK